MDRNKLRGLYIVVLELMIGVGIGLALAACSLSAPVKPPLVATVTPRPSAVLTPTSYPTRDIIAGYKMIRWFIGLGPGTEERQLDIELAIVDSYNASPERVYDASQVVMEVVPYENARDTIFTEMRYKMGPDVIGPVGWVDANALPDPRFVPEAWMDLTPLIKKRRYDLSQIDTALLNMATVDKKLVGIPLALYPAALEWNATLFEKAGLQAPPVKVGERYRMPDGTQVEWNWETLAKVAQLLTLDANGKNATEAGFDAAHIVQYGFTWGHETNPALIASFWQADSLLMPGGVKGNYQAAIPTAWHAAWAWTSDGVRSSHPFIATGSDAPTSFEVGKSAMTIETTRYLSSFGKVKSFQFAALPAYNGQVSHRLDMETLRMWEGSKVTDEAFTVLTSLIDQGSHKLLVECNSLAPAFDAVPARAADQPAFVDFRSKQFPWVKNWDTLLAAIKDPQTPAGEDKMPNIAAVWARLDVFGEKLQSTHDFDLAAEEAALVRDLTALFNK